MKKLILITLTLLQTSAHAAFDVDNYGTNYREDMVIPVVKDKTKLTDAVAGTVVYDSTAGAFFGLPVGGDAATSNNWAQLSTAQGTNAVSSGGTERIERANITCSSGSSVNRLSTTAWITVGNIASGSCTLTFATGTFSGTPSCTVGHNTSGLGYWANISASSSTAGTIRGTNWSGASIQNDTSYSVDVICMGPR
ncbi:MAG: hypothetical protein A4S09_01305 [Proteobacteria bacterium SG_bin7]|nr:MAG: hypothetical protein A4S09_01305 [Proteobacteria bacterium SG_bin7]